MFSAGDTRPGSGTLLELAALRGRMLELIVQRHMAQHRNSDYHECAFITGILSLVDKLFEVPVEEVLCHLNLSEEVRSALLCREGGLGMLLRLVEHLEQSDYASALPMLAELEISQDQLLVAQLEAINWTHTLTEPL